MGTKVLITIDTECDNMWSAQACRNPAFANIENLPRLQALFDRFKAKPTYLVTYSVANSGQISVLKDIAKSSSCEIGTHLHAMETPPFVSQRQGDGSFLHQYDVEAQAEKLANIDRLLTDVFAKKPVSYRGGRWSINHDLLVLLSKKGYFVDSSVTPGISWQRIGGLNFKKNTNKDHFSSEGVLEVPASMVITSRLRPLAVPLYMNLPDFTHIEGILRRLSGFDIIWLDPSFNDFEKMKLACQSLIEEGADFLNIIFHSSVIIAGGTPFTMTQEKVDLFFQRLEQILDFLINQKGLSSITVRQYYDYRKANFN